uniref:Uncharacterized protein n=1 Tax=Strigamia maritima TaxID=126957 RepID=T1J618_STRMM
IPTVGLVAVEVSITALEVLFGDFVALEVLSSGFVTLEVFITVLVGLDVDVFTLIVIDVGFFGLEVCGVAFTLAVTGFGVGFLFFGGIGIKPSISKENSFQSRVDSFVVLQTLTLAQEPMKLHTIAWFNAITFCKYLFYVLVLDLLCVQSVSWTVWPNNFYLHHHHMNPAWMNPNPTFNLHPPPYNVHHATFPEQHQLLPLPYRDYNSRNNFQNYEYLSPQSTSQQVETSNYQLLNHSSASFKVSNPIVRHVSSKNKSNLMLYQAPPSYDRIMDPPPSIIITSRPFSVTTTEKNSNFVSGEVKLANSSQVQFVPQQNIAASVNYKPNWNTGVTLQVSLRPGSWTKSKRPTISDEMKQFLPELKYYKKGLKSVDVSQVKSKVEKYVLVSKKEPDMVRETVAQPSIALVANDLLVYPQDSAQDSTKEIKLPNEWDNDSEEEQQFLHNDVPVVQKINTDTPGTDSPSTTTPINLNKTPQKSIEDIVAEVFASASPLSGEELEENSSSPHEKGLSDLFDMIYGNTNNNNSNDNSWLKLEPKQKNLLNTTVQLVTAPPDLLPLPELDHTIIISNKNSVTSTSESTITSSVLTENEFHSEEMIIRCQGMWCHHSTPRAEPVALKSQQNWEKSGNEINPHDHVPRVDPLLSYLGLAWPQHDRQSKILQSTQPTNPRVLEKLTTTTQRIAMTEQQTTLPPLPLPYFRDNDVKATIPKSDNRPNYKELKGFERGENDINTSPPSVTRVSREQLEVMFNALGHGFGQVMSIVMPLAMPIHKENDPSESSGLNLDFDNFF